MRIQSQCQMKRPACRRHRQREKYEIIKLLLRIFCLFCCYSEFRYGIRILRIKRMDWHAAAAVAAKFDKIVKSKAINGRSSRCCRCVNANFKSMHSFPIEYVMKCAQKLTHTHTHLLRKKRMNEKTSRVNCWVVATRKQQTKRKTKAQRIETSRRMLDKN